MCSFCESLQCEWDYLTELRLDYLYVTLKMQTRTKLVKHLHCVYICKTLQCAYICKTLQCAYICKTLVFTFVKTLVFTFVKHYTVLTVTHILTLLTFLLLQFPHYLPLPILLSIFSPRFCHSSTFPIFLSFSHLPLSPPSSPFLPLPPPLSPFLPLPPPSSPSLSLSHSPQPVWVEGPCHDLPPRKRPLGRAGRASLPEDGAPSGRPCLAWVPCQVSGPVPLAYPSRASDPCRTVDPVL